MLLLFSFSFFLTVLLSDLITSGHYIRGLFCGERKPKVVLICLELG